MEDALHSTINICLYISLPYLLGVASRVWWELKFFLLFVIGCVFSGLFLKSAVFGQDLTIGQNIQNVISYVMILTPLGYFTAPPIIKYFGIWLEKILGSDEFDATYRNYAKRHKTAYANDDKDAFDKFSKAYKAEQWTRSGTFHERSRAGSSTQYEEYSQYRRSQTSSERAAPPHQQDYGSDKDKMFDILEVSDRNANAKALKSAYRKLAWKYHPDVLAKNELSDAQLKQAEARMQEINQAYDWLKDNGFAE